MCPLLVPYDPLWPVRFEEIAQELRRCGDPGWMIEHIGSTSVPGMPAKPIIDLAVRVLDQHGFEVHRPALERAGWRLGSGIVSHRVMLFEEAGVRRRICHFFEAAEWDTANQRILRDRLRSDQGDAARYLLAKHAAEAASERGDASYNDGKTAVIQEIVDRARALRGLPSVPVRDKRSQSVADGDATPRT